MIVLASIAGFFGTVWWTVLVAVVAFAAGVGLSTTIKKYLNRG